MTREQFDAIFDSVVERCRWIHKTKGTQYANGEDRLGNFKRMAAKKSVAPETILSVFADKHRDTLDYVNRIIEETGEVPTLAEPLLETISDIVNYAILNYALVVEREHGAQEAAAFRKECQP